MNDKNANEKIEMVGSYDVAVRDIKEAILKNQYLAAKGVNRIQLSLYYGIGRYISANSRNGFWGTDAIQTISDKLRAQLPGLKGFSTANLKFMRQFYEEWEPYLKSLTAVSDSGDVKSLTVASDLFNRGPLDPTMKNNDIELAEFMSLGFSFHMLIIRATDDTAARLFYIHAAVVNSWSKEILKARIADDTYSHQGNMPNNFMQTISGKRSALKAVEMFKDEYMLDFINTEEIGERDAQDINERVVENAIVHNIRNFILTFGKDFALIGNQYHVEALGHDHYIDLLFYNRDLCSLVAIELKTGGFKPIYLGELNTYLQVLDDFVKKPNENPSVGLVLCKSADKAYAEYAVRDYSKPMGVATYKTASDMPERLRRALPDIEELKKLL